MQHPTHSQQHSSHGAAAVLKLTVAPTGIVMLRTLTVLLNWAQPCRTTGVPVGIVTSVAAVAVLNKVSQRTIVLVSCMHSTSVRMCQYGGLLHIKSVRTSVSVFCTGR
jgi:hypothetical protein